MSDDRPEDGVYPIHSAGGQRTLSVRAGEIWACTGESRWLRTGHVPAGPTVKEVGRAYMSLQQRWVRISGLGSAFDDEEWRDVPTVEES